ncbi:MAG: Unknown protein [uncultured Sulfurovum sp.]|uniref:TP-1001-like C-terminal domain-containing protein n=1 Tax=uncultured Sulfurovum sp. TaxID=269237 RepID=A0A6S6SV72_9BACT|nr:MAG: Unknown protein [uncultured Sulfurovum sp.]
MRNNTIKIIVLLLLFSTSLYSWKMEADKIVIKNTKTAFVTHINFRQTYDTVPLIFTLPTDSGSDSATIRINNISTTGFDAYIVEPDGDNGAHGEMSAIPYIAIEEGNHELPDGTKVVAQKVSTNKFQSKLISGSGWKSISLSGFNTAPTVLGEVQTRNSERTDLPVPNAVSQPWMTTAISAVTSSGFSLALERSETSIGTLQNEDVAYLAMESGLHGANHYFASNEADKIEYESIRSTDTITGWSNSATGDVINFSKTYSNPIAIANKNTRDGADGGWLRRRNISTSSISLVVDEDISNDTDRSHTDEIVGVLLFSEPFDAEFIYSGQAEMKINEVMYQEITTGTANEEFVEFLVSKSGNLNGYILSDQDTNYYIFPPFTVNQGEYVVYHTGAGVNSSSNGIHHFYRNSSTILNNTGDEVLLLKPSNDMIVLSDNKVFNAVPFDYVAYETASNVDAIPTSEGGVTLSWDFSYATELDDADDGLSISLSPNGVDGDSSACWEFTASGNASDNGCSGYILTVDTDLTSSYTYSIGVSNTNPLAKPDIKLEKTSLTIYDPINMEANPKAIPGALVKYTILARNEGLGITDENTIAIGDNIPANMKLCVSTVSRCTESAFVEGVVNSTLSLGSVEYSNNNGTDFLYTPTADAEGFDIDVTNVRVKLNGSFKESDGVNHPSFSLELKMGIL